MAGGGGPRQRMINMMYLVLTALLALQVSNSVLEKFIFIDETLQESKNKANVENDNVKAGIAEKVKESGNRPDDMAVQTAASEIREETAKVIAFTESFRDTLAVLCGGFKLDDEGNPTRKLATPQEYDSHHPFTLGIEGASEDSGGDILEKKLNDYSEFLNKKMADVKAALLKAEAEKTEDDTTSTDRADIELPEFNPIAVGADQIDVFKDDPDQAGKDFKTLNFDHAPVAAARAIVSELENEVMSYEARALKSLAALVGATQLRFDDIFAVVSPTSRVVANGTPYEAELILAARSSTVKPDMYMGGSRLQLEDGKGKVKFVANVKESDYDAEGNAKRVWTGRIVVKRPIGGDTTIQVEEEYIVARPVIRIEAAAVSALYYNCGNKLNIQVPALGTAYDPDYKVKGGQFTKGSKKGLLTVVPKQRKVEITVYSGGNRIGTEKFNVKSVPKPDVVLLSRGKPVDQKNGVGAKQLRSLTIKAIPDKEFAAFLPDDARYRIAEWEVTLARGRRILNQETVRGSQQLRLNQFVSKADKGDRYVIEVKKVERQNFKREIEEVNMGQLIYQIPLN